MTRAKVSVYGTIPYHDPRLIEIPSAGKQCYLHWAAALGFTALSQAWTDETGLSPLLAGSGWRPHRWTSRKHYEQTLINKYQGRTDLRCKKGDNPPACPCMPHIRSSCLYIAFSSPHETGLAVDFRCHGLAPVSKTIAQQRKTKLYRWLTNNASSYGWTPYAIEPWHWEFIIPKSQWVLAGAEAY